MMNTLHSKISLITNLFSSLTQNKCVPYWPAPDGTKEAGLYIVTCTLEREAADYKIRVLELYCLHTVIYKHLCV